MEKEVFIVFNTACIGDMLVTNALVQNIKYYYPDSYVVFVCNTPFVDVAKYQDGVDEVIDFDKKRGKSLRGILDFVKRFPYKKTFASFVTYANDRNLLISRLLGTKHIISNHKLKFWNTREKYELKEYTHMKDKWAGLIEPLTGEYKNLPIKYNAPQIQNPITESIKALKNPVAICATSNFCLKDMKPEHCIELMNLLHKEGMTPVLTGAGAVAKTFSCELKRHGYFDYVDIVDCTNFIELANILKICNACISVDTGTLHFANALNVPVVGIFYAGHDEVWGSDTTLYPAKILSGKDITPTQIIEEFKNLCGVCI